MTFSLFDGVAKVRDLVRKAADLGMPAIALTDHGAVGGWAQLHDECHRAGMLPLLGVEAYMVDDVTLRTRQKRRHLCLLALNQVGFSNLVKLATLSAMYFYFKPVLDLSLLARYNEGIAVTTACLGGWCAQPFFRDTGYDGCGTGENGAEAFHRLREVFGDRLYLEIQPYGSEAQRRFNEWAIAFARRDGAKIIATNDVHYVEPTDAQFQKYAIMSGMMAWGRKGDGNNDMVDRYVNKPEGHHVRTSSEMTEAFGQLHGAAFLRDPVFQQAMRAPWEIYLRAGVVRIDTALKIPAYPGDVEVSPEQFRA